MAECSQHPACPPVSDLTPLGQEERPQAAGSPALVRGLAQAPVGSRPAPGPQMGEKQFVHECERDCDQNLRQWE